MCIRDSLRDARVGDGIRAMVRPRDVEQGGATKPRLFRWGPAAPAAAAAAAPTTLIDSAKLPVESPEAQQSKPNRHTNLILIGGRGCGKSALCRRIMAAEPRFSLYSLDDIIVESSGMSIPRMVQDFGWRHFREVEFEVCKRVALLCDRGWCLIDAGGGVVVDLDDDGDETYSQRKVDTLKRNGLGKIVYLRRDVEYLVTRTSGDRNRPSLSDVRSFEQVMGARLPWYERAADYVVDATGGSVEKEVKNKQEIKREVLRYFYQVTGEVPADEQYRPPTDDEDDDDDDD